jgi:hypothetical protein
VKSGTAYARNVRLTAAPGIDMGPHYLKMIRPHASTVSAQVIDVHAFWYLNARQDEGHSVGIFRARNPAATAVPSIASLGFTRVPFPASIANGDLGSEAFGPRHCLLK